MVEGQSAVDEQLKKAREIVSELALAPEVLSIGVSSGPDSTGEPSLWVSLNVSRDLQADKEQVKRLTSFARAVQGKLIDGGITLFPYTRLEQAA